MKTVRILLAIAYGYIVLFGVLMIGVRALVTHGEAYFVATHDLQANWRLTAGDVKPRGKVAASLKAVEGRYLPYRLDCGDRIRPEELRDAPLLPSVPGTALVPVALTGTNARLVNAGTMLIIDWNAVRYRGRVKAVVVQGATSTALLRLREQDLRRDMFVSGAAVFVNGE
jgi:hypothetical protein